MDRKPIKRNEHIVNLSREHHTGLLFCWKIRQGLRKQADTIRMQQYVAYFWENHLIQHFREEEELLFNKVNDDLCRKALHDHAEIKSLIDQVLRSQPNLGAELLNSLADFLDSHIRYEERELFPHLEKILGEQELERIGAALAESQTAKAKDNYPDAFWVQ